VVRKIMARRRLHPKYLNLDSYEDLVLLIFFVVEVDLLLLSLWCLCPGLGQEAKIEPS
jgi:hypothetical protein